ncbi:serine protease; identified by sequence similarity; putative; ORF located using Blastx/Glimmer [hydrothermal vent metagenome]|uniref:Serine protease identified by sequence similarity putative ORF located using Blastx/Glimmer n=1 Tax=hydrothermal vent metagenome TaxID=652676 RepID=A0A1W1EJS5_9ZZZZ
MKIIKYLMLIALFINISYAKKVDDSIVKIYTVFKTPSYDTPWNSSIQSASGSGVVIEGNRILTNAHVVANSTFLEVKRNGDTKRYRAKVEFVSHQVDLAVIKLVDEKFFDGVEALKIGKRPVKEQKVSVYGFPLGGNTLSITTGIVSRIEHISYVHSGEIFLGVQVDAAINSGNSGGPAITDGKIVGVVMQGMRNAQNVGYLISVDIINKFLEDIKDGKLDGFADLGLSTMSMENPTIREYYKMDKDTTGILITQIAEVSKAYDKLKEGDILLEIDGHKVENDGKVEFEKGAFTYYSYYFDKKQIGESIPMTILRDGKKVKVLVELNNVTNKNLLVPSFQYDKMPRYYILGGYVFSPLTRNLLYGKKYSLLRLKLAQQEWATKDKREIVVLLKVLATDLNRGDHNYSLFKIDKINNREFKDFKEFVDIIKKSKDKFIVLEGAKGAKIVIDNIKAKAIEKEILDRYNIKDSERL